MLSLFWDTSTTLGHVVCARTSPGDQLDILTSKNLEKGKRSAESLLGNIDFVLRSSKIKANEVDVVGCSLGPGSFTGIRGGIVTADSWAISKKVQTRGIPSLAIWAHAAEVELKNSLSRSENFFCLVVSPGVPGEVYFRLGPLSKVASSRWAKTNILRPKLSLEKPTLGDDPFWEGIATWEEFPKIVATHRKTYQWKECVGVFSPDARQADFDFGRLDPQINFRYQVQEYPSRSLVALLASARHSQKLEARYFRPSDAEIKLNLKMLPKGPTRC